MAITIAMINQKGGCGKTTTSIEFAACFSKQGYKVLLIDMDQQANATDYSRADSSVAGTYESLIGTASIVTSIQHTDEYDVLAGSEKLSTIDSFFANNSRGFLQLRKVIREINDIYDFIILDTNPGRNLLLNMAYVAADYVIIPADADEGSLKGIRDVIVDIKNYKDDELTDAEILGVVITRAEANTTVYDYAKNEIEEMLNISYPDAFCMTVRKGIAANESHIEGKSMQLSKHNSNPAIDYRNITNKILELCV